MSGLWESVPQVRWTGNRPEAGQVVNTEPSVAANAAASVTKSDVKPPSSSTPENPPFGGFANADPVQAARGVETSIHRSAGGYGSTDVDRAAASVLDSAADSTQMDQGQDQIEQLKAALDYDAERAQGSPRQSGTSHDIRVRVDVLVEKARHLFDLGQFREARHTAKVAHDLGDSARLDYSPDEERPIDLVQRIDDRIKETMEQGDKVDASATTVIADPSLIPDRASAASTSPVANAAVDRKLSAMGKAAEPEPNVKARKDWTQGLSVFRRDRKSNPSGSPLTTPASTALPNTGATTSPLRLDAEVETNDPAVVQANRSLTLSKPTPTISSVERQGVVEFPAIATDLSQESSETISPALGTDATRDQPDTSIAAAWPDDFATPRKLKIEEPTSAPVDFEEVEPLSPFRDVAGQSSSATSTLASDSPRACDQSWIIGIALFAACAILAVFWYRRGAV